MTVKHNAATLVLCLLFAGTVNSQARNVILLFSDQHNKKVMGFEGHPDVITPNLDRLAREGMVFDRAYCSTGICVPSRCSLMTGLYPRTLGILSNGGATSVANQAVSMATIFKQNHYSTYAFGKRHLKGSIDEGWDVHKSHMHNESPDENYVTWLEAQGYAREFAEDWAAEFGRGPNGSSQRDTRFPTADLGTRLSKLPEDCTMEAYTTRQTIEMIKTHGRSGKPFFCWANFYRPHQPYTPLKKYMDLYDVTAWGRGTKKGDAIKKPASFYEPTDNLPPLLQSQRNGGNRVWNMDKAFANEQLWRNFIGAYYALVTEIDHCVGQILDALEEAGMEEDTLVIYTSDHGDFVGNHGMVEKAAIGHNVYEDILNVPLIIRLPGKSARGTRTAELVSLVDVLPTLIDLLGLQVPQLAHPPQGRSMVDLILKNKPMNRDYVISESWSQAAVITKDHKLGIMLDPTVVHRHWDYRGFGDMFFDRAADPLEIRNGIHDTKHRSTIQTLRSHYEAFKREVPDTGKAERIRQASTNAPAQARSRGPQATASDLYARMVAMETPRILHKAAAYLEAEPCTVTADRCERSQGGLHDFYSEGDYWWPDPNDPDGPFIRRDGQTYTGLFMAHRHAMVRLSDIVGTLTSAYLITQDGRYVTQAVKHLKAWFVDAQTRMNPSLLYGQAIKGRSTGRSIGIIDTLHLSEVARGAKILCGSPVFAREDQAAVKAWFRDYLTWINTHAYGVREKVHPNNHGVCWSMQAAAFADLVGDDDILAWIRHQFKTVYLAEMMDSNGGFPAELKRTKPYGYSLFVIDAMAGVAQIASTPQDNLWTYTSSNGRSMRRGMEFIVPYIRDKSAWPYQKDVLYWDQWPVRQPSLLFAAAAFGQADTLNLSATLAADPEVFEVLRNLPLRHPMLWVGPQSGVR